MTPSEFVSRVIDLFEFDLPDWPNIRPKNFQSAALCIRVGEGSVALGERWGHVRQVSGYRFELEADQVLGHVIIRASMLGFSNCALRASVCFPFEDQDIVVLGIEERHDNHILGAWQVPPNVSEVADEVVSMIAYLTLKTNYTIKHKTLPH